MNKKKKYKDWNETSYALHLFLFEGLHYLYSSPKRSWNKKMRNAHYMQRRVEMHEFGVST
jgi:hypothetical protein